MKKLVKQYEEKTIALLQKEAGEMRKEIGKLMIEAGTNPQKDTNTLMKKRRSLAVLMTILSRKQLLEATKTVKS
jgi:ribosomal protein L29